MPWFNLLIAIAISIVGELLRPKPKTTKIKPSSLSDFQFPTSDPSRTIGLFRGTCKMMGMNVTWFGDYSSVKRTKRVKTGWFSSETVDLGFNYYLGFQGVFALGDASIQIIDIMVTEDEKTVKNGSLVDHGSYYSMIMNSPEIINAEGDFKEGVSGPIKIYKGTATQPVNAYLDSKLPELETSAFRRVMYMVAEKCYLGNSNTPPPLGIIAKCCPNPLALTGSKQEINGDYNPASFIYEVYTENAMWGLSVDPAEMDIDSFVECAETLYTEGLGVSMTVDQSTKGRDLLEEILRHVDGVVFRDPVTGLWTMKLARADYNVFDLPLFTNNEIEDDTFVFSRTSYDDTRNVTTVNYTDRSKNFQVVPIDYKNPANIFARDGTIDAESYDFLGISNKDTADLINRRVNRTVSNPLARIEFSCKRGLGSSLRPGGVIRVTKPDRGITGELVMRVVKPSYGTLDDPRVKVVLMEDIYAKNHTAFGAPADTGWVPLYDLLSNISFPRVVEAPYEMVGRESRHFMVLAARGDNFTQGFEIWSAKAGELYYKTTGEGRSTIVRSTILVDFDGGSVNDLLYGGSGFPAVKYDEEMIVAFSRDMETLESVEEAEWFQGVNLLMVDDEIMAWKTITNNGDGTATITGIIRGLYDTVMTTHDADFFVYFLDRSIPLVDQVPMIADDTRLVKLVPYSHGTFKDFDTCPMIIAGPTESRAFRPNPPGKIRVNGERYGFGVVGILSQYFVALSWQNRDKTLLRPVTQDEEMEGEFGVLAWLKISDFDQPIDVATGARPILFYAEHIRSPATFHLGPNVGNPGFPRNVRIEIGAIDFDGQLSLQHWVIPAVVTDGIGIDEFHVIYDEAFDPTERIEEIAPVLGVLTFDCSISEQFRVSLNSNVTEVRFINVPENKIVIAEFLNYGAYTVAGWPNSVMWVSGTPYVASITGALSLPKRDLVGLETKTGGILWLGRVSQDEANEAGVPEVLVFSASVAPNPAYHYSTTAPAVAVVVSTANGVGPYTYDWQRAAGGLGTWGAGVDNLGGANFNFTSLTSATPTISRTTTNTNGLVTQNWLCTVTDTTTGKIAKLVLEVSLEDDGDVVGGYPPTCVHEDSYCPGIYLGSAARQAKDIQVADCMVVVDLATGKHSLAVVSYAETVMALGLVVNTLAGVVLRCSETAEIGTKKGRVLACDLLGQEVYVNINGMDEWSLVIGVDPIPGLIPVRHFTCEDNYFLAGDVEGAYMAHHNVKNIPDPFEGEV